MVNKKSHRGHSVSKVSSAAVPSQSASVFSANAKSSVLRSAFSPSEYQLSLFASVIQGLGGHHLRIHDLKSSRLECDHAAGPRELITSLDWGYYHGDASPAAAEHTKKKRKRNSGANGNAANSEESTTGSQMVVAFGTSTSEIRMYSPAENKVIGSLSGVHERGIRDFKFTAQKPGQEGWSLGGDGKLVQWDLRRGRSIQVITLPSMSVATLSRPVPSNPPLLCASQTPYIIDLEKGVSDRPFDAMRNTVHTLISSSADLANLSEQFLAADTDRYIQIFDIKSRKLLGSLVADREVELVSLYGGASSHQKNSPKVPRSALLQQQVLAVLTQSGSIELFDAPFYQLSQSSNTTAPTGASLKSLRKTQTRRATAIIKLVRPDKYRSSVPVVSACFDGPDLVIAWAEAGNNLSFERIRWQKEDSEELALNGEVEIAKARSAPISASTVTNGVKDVGKTHVDESHAIVEQGGIAEGITQTGATQDDAISIGSSDDDEEDEDVGADIKNHVNNEDVEMADANPLEEGEDDEEENQTGEPSFGELVRASKASEPIDVDAALEDTDADAGPGGTLIPSNKKKALASSSTPTQSLPSGLSLATVLNQSLKTNDNTLLESCLHTTDLNIVRATIQRIDSSLAAILLQKLAERLSTRPGRYGHLLVWVQWTCVAHGGAIAGRPGILKQMSSLFKVMDQRSACLPPLLLLKGKLDMLDAQLGLRQSLQRSSRPMDNDWDDEEGVIYVEGQENEAGSGDGDGVGGGAAVAAAPATKPRQRRNIPRGSLKAQHWTAAAEEEGDSDGEDDEEMPLTVNGIVTDDDDEGSDEEGDDDGDDDNENLVDNEAELSFDEDEGEEVSSDKDEDEDEDGEDVSMDDFIADTDDESEIGFVEEKKKQSNKSKAGGSVGVQAQSNRSRR